MVAILDHMSALADPTRCRILLVLEKHELTVSELCAVLQLPQSSVSRHLKTLADDDWVISRRDGTGGRNPEGGAGCATTARRARATPGQVRGVLRDRSGWMGPAAR